MNPENSGEDDDFDFAIRMQNLHESEDGRGSEWRPVRNKKRKKGSSGSIDAESFSSLSCDDKLICLFGNLNRNYDSINEMKNDQKKYYQVTQDLQSGMTGLCKRAENAERVIDKQSECIKMLAYRTIDMESRSRRNNVIFWGITEKVRINTENLVLGFIEDELNIDPSGIVIDRAHRLGSVGKAKNKQDPKRPIIARFRDFQDTELIMKNAYKLKGSSFGLDRDYPKEIANARRELYQSYEAKQARQNKQKVQISYPAKLYVGGKLIRDKFPEWQTVLSESRLKCFDFENVTEKSSIHTNNRKQTLYSNDTVVDRRTESSSSDGSSDESVFIATQTQRSAGRHAPSIAAVTESHDQSRDMLHDITPEQVEANRNTKGLPKPRASSLKSRRSRSKSKSRRNGRRQSSSSTNTPPALPRNEQTHRTAITSGGSHTDTQTINRTGTNPHGNATACVNENVNRNA